jgi:hypothetical protein
MVNVNIFSAKSDQTYQELTSEEPRTPDILKQTR